MPSSCREDTQMSGSDWETIPDVREPLPYARWCLAGSPKYPGVVGRLSRMSGSGREALPDVRERSEGSAECP